jgi:septum site-determining protein MinC
MNKKNYVVFKGRRDGILVALNPDCDFSELKEALRAKAKEAASFFSDTTTAIFLSGRETSEREETELLEIFFEETQLNISYVSSQGTEIEMKRAEPELLREIVMPNLNEVREELELLAEENNTLYHRGSLRSGQAINYAGSVVMIGDVNIGAEIIAEGNVVVLGGARGLIHAGCSGNPNCFVYAL